MITKDYTTFFFQERIEELPKNHQETSFFRSYFSEKIGIKISECIINKKIRKVYYHEVSNIQLIQEFHEKKYSNITKIGLLKTKTKNTVFVEVYNRFKFKTFEIFRFDKFDREKESLLFLQNFSLSQYNESIYATEQDELPIKEKTFYPSLWKIEEEDMD